MATINGMTAERMQEILDGTIETATIVGATLVFHKVDGSTFSAGDFQVYIDDKVDAAVSTEVASALSGGLTAKGNVSGAIAFAETAAQIVNRVYTATLIGNISIDVAALPASPMPGTQFAMVLKQDGTGNRLLTLTNIKRSQGVLVLSTAANSTDIIMFMYDGSSWYAGPMGLKFS